MQIENERNGGLSDAWFYIGIVLDFAFSIYDRSCCHSRMRGNRHSCFDVAKYFLVKEGGQK